MSFIEGSLLSDSIATVENIFDYIDKTLEEPDTVYTEIDELKQKTKLKEIQPILNIIENFISRRKALLYGGTALNMLLPNDLKFYGVYEIPDYDFFYPDAANLAKEIADELYLQGYKYTEVKNALHEGTYKVYCNFESVADVTEIPQSNYTVLVKNSTYKKKKANKLYVAPIEFLKAVAYKELCMPISSGFRWSKVYRRLLLLENQYPINMRLSKTFTGTCDDIFEHSMLPDNYLNIEHFIKKYVVDNKYAYIGNEAIYFYLKNTLDCSKYNNGVKKLHILSKNIKKTATDFSKSLKKHMKFDLKTTIKTKIDYYDEFEMFLPIKSVVSVKLGKGKFEKVLSIYDASDNCYSIINTTDKNMICSIFFLYYVLYFKILFCEHKSNDPKLKSYKFILLKLRDRISEQENEADLFEKFTSECYGVKKGMTAVKKSIWDKKKKIMYYRPGDKTV